MRVNDAQESLRVSAGGRIGTGQAEMAKETLR